MPALLFGPIFVGEWVSLVHLGEIFNTILSFENFPSDEIKIVWNQPPLELHVMVYADVALQGFGIHSSP
jgi:hypothetical protein